MKLSSYLANLQHGLKFSSRDDSIDAKTIPERLVSLPARLAHGYPQGWIYKVFVKKRDVRGSFVYFILTEKKCGVKYDFYRTLT